MAWIESHQSLGRHPKVYRLASKLRIHKAQAIGHLQYLWWWTLDFAPTGNLSQFTPAEISAGAEWPGQPGPFHDSLKECGWLDEDGTLHNWGDYAGKLIEKREIDRDRKRASRLSNGHPSDGARTAHVPNPTNPTNPTPGPDGDKLDDDQARHFAQLWIQANYPVYNRKFSDFASVVVQLGKSEAIRRVQEAIAAGKTANPFSYVISCVVSQQARDTANQRAAIPVTGWQEGVLPDGQKQRLAHPPKAVG